MSLGKNLKRIREARGLTQHQLASLTNGEVSQGIISALEKRDSKASRFAYVLAKALDVDVHTLVEGNLSTVIRDESEVTKETEEDHVSFELLNVEASAGNGSFVLDEESIGKINLSKKIAKETIGNNLDKIKAIYVKGDSMEPSICDGDIVFVDTSQKLIKSDGIYVFVYLEKLHIKRIQITDCFVIKSDNNKYEDFRVKESDINVVGKVVKTWKL